MISPATESPVSLMTRPSMAAISFVQNDVERIRDLGPVQHFARISGVFDDAAADAGHIVDLKFPASVCPSRLEAFGNCKKHSDRSEQVRRLQDVRGCP